jgi:hypothetical protein
LEDGSVDRRGDRQEADQFPGRGPGAGCRHRLRSAGRRGGRGKRWQQLRLHRLGADHRRHPGAADAGHERRGPQLAGTEGRHVYYTLVVQSTYTRTDWSWGDNSPGAPDSSVPGQCGQVPHGGVLVAHTYKQYSGAQPFPVTATRHYTIDVTELWVDANGPHEADMPNAVGPLDITALNQPYPKQVTQEEGVPIS